LVQGQRKSKREQEIGVSLITPEKVRKLQTALHAKAKRSPNCRFHQLYDKVYREDVLALAYRRCAANGGAAGADGQTFEDIESYDLERWLGELTQELRTKAYRPQAVRRVWIPKPDGRSRPLGIPTVKDRVVQMAAVLVLDPIFEADMPPEQFAYRHGKGALEAVKTVRALVEHGHDEVGDADLSGYFDSIPHTDLMKSVARRVCDRQMLRLIKMWLEAPIEETDEQGRTHRTTRNRDEHRGTPQGAPISPLLANLYMRRFVLWWKQRGYERQFGARIVNYADDFVICCRGNAARAMTAMRQMMTRLKLTVNEAKTHIRRLPGESFDFLGYTIGRCYAFRTGKPYIGMKPSKAAIRRMRRRISEATTRSWYYADVQDRVRTLNHMMIGWANYFCLGPVGRAYGALDRHAQHRLRRWLCRKHKVPGRGTSRFPTNYLYEELGLVRLEQRRRIVSWAPA
jgi:group II intron reverse transcriptase/maturase